MKRQIFLAIAAVILLPLAALGAELEIKKGDSIKVDSPDRAEVKNLEVIRNKTREFYFGDVCHFKNGGTLTTIAKEQDLWLVRYSTKEEVDGSLCPNDAIFFYPEKKFIEATKAQIRRLEKTQKEKELIKKLLGR